MPLAELSELQVLYEAIKDDLAGQTSQEQKLIIFVSGVECDSVCATRTLQSILVADGVCSSVFVVASYTELQNHCQALADSVDKDPRNFLLINCGAQEDIRELLQITDDSTRVIVIDSHRPVHLNYQRDVAGWEQIHLVYDPVDGTQLEHMPEPEGFSSEEEDDEEELGFGAEPDDNENDENDAGNRSKRKQREEQRKEARKERRRAMRKRRRQHYERGSHWGRPATHILYELARALHLEDSHMLWMSIVALTDQYVHQRIPEDKYQAYVGALETAVNQLPSADAEHDIVLIANSDVDGEFTQTSVKKPVYGHIRPGEDFRFTLMRHWTLYDAMLHSAYVAVRMHTYTDKGQRSLNDLLAKMGFRIKDCQHDYSSMRSVVTNNLGVQLRRHASAFQLAHVSFRSFFRKWGYAPELAASDIVHAVTAHLESEPKHGGSNSDKFWNAWKALGATDDGELRQGLELAKKLQRAILSDGGMLLARHAVKEAAKFRHVNLVHEQVNNQGILAQPLALAKLAFFLRDVFMHSRNNKPKAFVVVGPPSAERQCLVVAVIDQPSPTSSQGNQFGVWFRKAAERMQAECRHDLFDSAVVQMAANDTERFMRELSAICNTVHLDQAA